MFIHKRVLVLLALAGFMLFIYSVRDQPTHTVTKTHTVRVPVTVTKTVTVERKVLTPIPAACIKVETELKALAAKLGSAEAQSTSLQDSFDRYHEQLVDSREHDAFVTLKNILANHEVLSNINADVRDRLELIASDMEDCR